MRSLLSLSLAFLLSACTRTDSTDGKAAVRAFAETADGASCPTAECMALNQGEEDFLTIVTN